MTLSTISRRGVLAAASAGAMACLSQFVSSIRSYSARISVGTDSNDLVALCSELGCPKSIGKACLLALPAPERALSSLSTAVLGRKGAPRRDRWSPHVLAQSIRERSRSDFQEGRVLSVNGWILALTEARLYALAALLSETTEIRTSSSE